MRKYTIVLIYPTEMTDGKIETFIAWSETKTVKEAIKDARETAALENSDDDLVMNPDSFEVLAVFHGHLWDQKDRVTYEEGET